MKILSVVPTLFGDNAMTKRIWHINKLLSLVYDVNMVQYTRKSTLVKASEKKFDLPNVRLSRVLASTYNVHLKHFNELNKNHYGVVYGNTHGGAFLSLLGKIKDVPLVFDMHGGIVEEAEFLAVNNNFEHKLNILLKKMMNHACLRFSEKILCVSRAMMDYLNIEKGIPLNRLSYVTNGVDLSFFKPVGSEEYTKMRKRLGIDGKFVFGYVGGYQRWQGISNLIEAAQKMRNNVVVLIVGGNNSIIEKKDNIIFVPRISQIHLPSYYSLADVLVLPRPEHIATEIAAPTKFAEYTAMSKPVLVTDVGDAGTLVKNYRCGIVVTNNDSVNLYEGMQNFVSMSPGELEKWEKNLGS